MSNSAMGALVLFCGHQAAFYADIHRIGDVNVVVASTPSAALDDHLHRESGTVAAATHVIVDFPTPGYWGRNRGVFVVPEKQVKELRKS